MATPSVRCGSLAERSCQRRCYRMRWSMCTSSQSPGIDLVLERPRENRAQFVFTTARGRDVIFWQSPKTTARSRPGVRVPTRRASGFEELTILIDTRERYPYRFTRQQATTQRKALPAGDYGVALDDAVVAVVERKTIADLARRLIDGNFTYALAEEWTFRFLGAALAHLEAEHGNNLEDRE